MRKAKTKVQKAPSPKIAERKFTDAWEVATELDALEERVKSERDEKERKKLAREIRGLENKITPTAKRAAADRNRPLVKAMQRYIQQNGVPSNIADLLEGLRAQGFKIAEDNAARDDNDVTARAARYILRERFGIEGQMGRKPKVL